MRGTMGCMRIVKYLLLVCATAILACSSDTGPSTAGPDSRMALRAEFEREITRLVDGRVLVGGCHGEAHTLGRAAAERLGPSVAFALNSPDLDEHCHYGFLHGLFQGLADGGASLIEHAAAGCGSLGHAASAECFHAVGHGVALTTEDLPRALDVCATLLNRDWEPCGLGAVMEYSDRYRLGPPVDDDEMHVAVYSSAAAERFCDDLDVQWLGVCAKEAAKFWGPSVNRLSDLGVWCDRMAVRGPYAELLTRCAEGAGRWLQNRASWVRPGEVAVPETAEAATRASTAFARECVDAAIGLAHAASIFLPPCLEFAMAPALLNQVQLALPPEVWVDACTASGVPLPQPILESCRASRAAIIASVS